MADFKSGHGLNFIGDNNYLVTTKETAEQLRGHFLSCTAVLVPDSKWKRLFTYFRCHDEYVARMRPASEMLWQMVRSRNNRVVQ